MNEFQQRWVDELRNGGHKQGKGRLAGAAYNIKRELVGWEYCCLGVAACKVAGASEEEFGGLETMHDVGAFDDFTRALGLGQSEQDDLADLNDRYNLTFGEIADVIERMITNAESPMEAAHNLGCYTGSDD